jgi:hypothetical protein
LLKALNGRNYWFLCDFIAAFMIEGGASRIYARIQVFAPFLASHNTITEGEA